MAVGKQPNVLNLFWAPLWPQQV